MDVFKLSNKLKLLILEDVTQGHGRKTATSAKNYSELI